MVSPELIRRYPFFAGLGHDYLVSLAKLAEEEVVATGHKFFYEGDELPAFYLVVEGAVSIDFAVPDRSQVQKVSGQLTGDLQTKDLTVSTVGTGDVFGWSALIPPYHATAGATAITPCSVVSFNREQVLQLLEQDHHLGYLMVQKAAQVIRERLREIRIESLASGSV